MRFYYKEDIFKLVKGRSIVLFGSGNIAQKLKALLKIMWNLLQITQKIYGELPTKILKFKILLN